MRYTDYMPGCHCGALSHLRRQCTRPPIAGQPPAPHIGRVDDARFGLTNRIGGTAPDAKGRQKAPWIPPSPQEPPGAGSSTAEVA